MLWVGSVTLHSYEVKRKGLVLMKDWGMLVIKITVLRVDGGMTR